MLYYTNPGEKRTDAVVKASVKAVEAAKASGTNQVVLTVLQLENLEGHVTEAFGDAAVKTLRKDRVVDFNGVTLWLETERISSIAKGGVALAPFVSPKLMQKITQDPRFTDVVYVPWSPEELKVVSDKWAPITEI